MTAPLRLRARDGEDLQVLSAALQDAIVPLYEMAFLKREAQFVMMVNRFQWERPRDPGDGFGHDEADATPGGTAPHHRCHCAVRVLGVTGVRSTALDLADRGRFHNLLSVTAVQGGIDLAFAGGGQIRLATPVIDVLLEDRGDPWPTWRRPDHGTLE